MVQAVVDGIRSPQHAHEADQVLRAIDGVIISRTDHNTRNLMMQLHPTCSLTAGELGSLLAVLQMSIRCYRRSPMTDAPFQHLDPRFCGPDPEPK